MVDVIHSPLSPSRAFAALEQYARDWHESSLPPVLRARRIVGLTLATTPDGFHLRLNSANRRSLECTGHFAATASGSILTYEIVSDRPSRLRLAVIGSSWLGVLLYFFLRRWLTLSLVTMAVTIFAFTAFGGSRRSASKLRVAVYEMFCSVLDGSDLLAAT